jgi:hypothetical protein
MHQSIQIPSCRGKPREIFYVQLPPQYATWQESEMGGGSLPTLAQQLKEKCGMNSQQIHYFLDPEEPAILEPLNEMVLALDPTMPRDHQKLRLSLANTLNQKDLFLYINGQVFQKVSDKQEVYWPLERGQFAFELGNSSEPFTSQAIHITVL